MTTNDNGGQLNTELDAPAGQNEADAPDLPEATDTDELDDTEGSDDGDGDDGDQDGGSRRNREAQYRRRAQAAEAERDQLRTQLDTLHRQIVSDIATAAGLPEVALLESAGHELAAFVTDEGTVDRAKVTEATAETMRRYNIRKRGTLTSNPQQGAHGVHAKSGGVAGVINEALGR